MGKICEFKNVNKGYLNHIVLEEFTFSVEEGEMLAITGKSGSGKTTVLNLLGMLDKADSGEISLFGNKIPRMGTRKSMLLLREKVAYLFQNYTLIDNADIGYNLDIPLTYQKMSKKEKEELKIKMLERVGLNLPLSQKIYELSGGEQQRVAIARILLRPCQLILADEPTGSLDEENRDAIMEILQQINEEGKTVILVTHDPVVSSGCKRVLELL